MTRGRAAVLGSPIAHSLSPVLHAAAYAELGLDWTYEAIECDAPALPSTLDRLAETHRVLSLTMPLKEAVLPLLDDLAPDARTLGAVNTVLFDDGRRLGANTDVVGVLAALDELGADPAGQRVALLGAGGAARAVLAALAARDVGPVAVVVREPARADGLRALAGTLGVSITVRGWSLEALAGQALVISAAPQVAVPAEWVWPAGAALLDLVYAPWPTPLAELAEAAGARVIGGLPMLVAQAAEQVRLMTGRQPPVEEMRRAGEAALRARVG
ncbi:MAG: shikimate dehydrogenase [Frankiaceae bacterium]